MNESKQHRTMASRVGGIMIVLWIAALPMLLVGLFLMGNGFDLGRAIVLIAALIGISFPVWLFIMLAKAGIGQFFETGDRSALIIALLVIGGLAWSVYGAFS